MSPRSLVTDAPEGEALDDSAAEASARRCQQGGKQDDRLVSLVQPGADAAWHSRVKGLWRQDPQDRLQPIPSTGARYRNEVFGYDG